MAWNFGNTTVRTPYRLQEALKALQNSTFQGNLIGKKQEHAFAKLLHDTQVVNSPRIEEGEDASDLGRKWRVALSQLGFITPKLKRNTSSGDIDVNLKEYIGQFPNLSGKPYEITASGRRLLNAKLLPEQQECFLRAIASYRLPSPIEKARRGKEHSQFSPLRFTLQIMAGVKKSDGESKLTFQEFAFFVQTSTPDDNIDQVIEEILAYRRGRKAAKGNVRAYDKPFRGAAAEKAGYAVSSLNDYADLSFRYLKATGLFKAAGKGITINASKAQLAALIRDEAQANLDNEAYLHSLWRGAKLPTDNVSKAYLVLQDLKDQLAAYGVTVALPAQSAPIEELKAAQYDFESRLSHQQELQYAADQASELEDIFNYFGALPLRSRKKDFNGVKIPSGEGPAYLEWVVWRSFLAINSLVNAPWEARRFQIDQDFLPVHCAPGGGPDMIFEFENMIVVVEVTLTDSSRQEAAEGEPVRRHVADYAEKNSKPVYGLFIALNIDSNTAHTFRLGDWYLKDDSKINLHIVPATLSDFENFLKSGETDLSELPKRLLELLKDCRMAATMDAPLWKNEIKSLFAR